MILLKEDKVDSLIHFLQIFAVLIFAHEVALEGEYTFQLIHPQYNNLCHTLLLNLGNSVKKSTENSTVHICD